MSDRHKLQHGVGITIIYLTLLLSIPASTSASKFKQRTRASLNPAHNEAPTLKRPVASSRVNIPRIYAAYRVLLTEGGGDAKINVGEIGKKIAVVEEEEDEAIQKSVDAFKQSAVTGIQTVIVKNLKEKVKDKKSSKTSLTTSDNAAKVEDSKCARIENVKDVDDKEKEKEKEQLEKDNPTLQGLLVVNMDPSSKSNKLRVKTLETVGKSHEKVAELDSAERRIAELNRVYKEFMNAWKRPTPESRGFSLLGKANKYPPRPINLNALNELMNVVENLQQSNPVDDIVKAINDAMNPDLEGPLSSNRPTVNSNNLVPTGQIPVVKRRISSRSSKKFKRVVSNVPADMKTGSLYEEYKKKLNDILQEQDHSHTSLATQVKVPIQAGTVKKLCALTQCHCDEGKPQIMSVDSAGPKLSNNLTPCHCEATRPASSGLEGDTVKITNGLAPCHCGDIRGPNMADVINACVLDARTGKTDKHLKDLNTCKQANKDNKLNGGLKPYYLSNSKHRQMVWNDVPLIRPGSPRKTEATKQNVPKNDKVTQTNGREPIVAKSCASKAKSEQNVVNSSLRKNDSHSESTVKRKNQLQHILKVFQSKHRSMNVRKTRKRGLAKFINGIEGTPANLAFPEVLVNKFGQTPETGGKLIENMAKQLNVSPMEMAQHIASSSGQSMGAGTYPMQANIASQTIGGQLPMATTNLKTATNCQAGQQGQAGNIAPMLEKILDRLECMQEFGNNQGPAEKLPCCFADPTDGAPCELTGSWESLLLGVRINIRDENKVVVPKPKPSCAQPKVRRSDTNRLWRQCVKINPAQIKESMHVSSIKALNVTIQETLPPRPHEMMENLTDWVFTGHAVSTLGGPISFNCRKLESCLMGTFVGFCRKCGCIDSIFGSWSFCQPSRDCQDITMSIFERRDVLRRFSLDDARRERLKENLYTHTKLGCLEKTRRQDAFKHTKIALIPRPQLD